MRRLAILFLSGLLAFGAAAGPASRSSVEREMQRADRLVQTVSMAEWMGPLAPIALSPFFGLTCLSGASLLVEQGVLPENRLLASSEALHHPGVFGVLLLLTLVTSLPRFTKVSKCFAQAVDQVETYAALVAWLVLVWFSGGSGVGEEPVMQAGLVDAGAEWLVAAAMVLNIVVIKTVKFFFEVLILLSPIPVIDAGFEILNKLSVGVLVAVYAFSPFAALVLNLLIFLACLAGFRVVRRRVRYFRMLLFGMIGRALPLRDHPARRPGLAGEGAIEVFPCRSAGPVPKLAHAWLLQDETGRRLVQPRWFGEDRILSVEGPARIEARWLCYRLVAGDHAFDFSRRYRAALPAIAACFGAELPADGAGIPRPWRREALLGRRAAESAG